MRDAVGNVLADGDQVTLIKYLERWCEQGVDTPGLVLIRVRAVRIAYWDGAEEGEVAL